LIRLLCQAASHHPALGVELDVGGMIEPVTDLIVEGGGPQLAHSGHDAQAAVGLAQSDAVVVPVHDHQRAVGGKGHVRG